MLAGAIVAGLGIVIQVRFGDAFATSLVPTGALMKRTIAGGGWAHQNWSAVNARTLTPEQSERLLDGLLRRLEDEASGAAGVYVTPDAHAWLHDRLRAAEVGPEHVARFTGDSLTVAEVRPARSSVGTPLRLTVRVRSSPRGQLSPVASWGVLIEGATLIGPDGAAVAPSVTADTTFRTEATLIGSTVGSMAFTIDVTEPRVTGSHRVRLILWRAILPPSMRRAGTPVTRDAAGQVVLPPEVIWAERMVVEHELEVTKPDGT
jgi:hypothetical protein